MQVKEGNIVITLPKDNYPDYTIGYIAILLRMLNKGLENPAVQINNLSLLTTGKPFKMLITKDASEDSKFLETLRNFSDSLAEVLSQRSRSNMSDTTVHDILGT